MTHKLTGLQTPLPRLSAIAVDPQGNVYFPVFWGDKGLMIMRMDPAGDLTPIIGGGTSLQPGRGPARFRPAGRARIGASTSSTARSSSVGRTARSTASRTSPNPHEASRFARSNTEAQPPGSVTSLTAPLSSELAADLKTEVRSLV